MKKNRIVNILFALIISTTCAGCKSQETDTGYDGKEFDISVSQDNSVKALYSFIGFLERSLLIAQPSVHVYE